jgi:hypothetical protein
MYVNPREEYLIKQLAEKHDMQIVEVVERLVKIGLQNPQIFTKKPTEKTEKKTNES